MKTLWKTQIIIWSDYDSRAVEIEDLAREATRGDSYCSRSVSTLIEDPQKDKDWVETEFFFDPDEEEL